MAYIRKRGNSYQIRVSCGMDDKGNQIERTTTWKPDPTLSDRQVEKELQRIATEFEEHCKSCWRSANIKFKAFAEEWFKEYAEVNLRSTSLERMRGLTNRVYPALGHISLGKVTALQIQEFINDLAQNGKNLKTGKPLARKTVVHHLSLISDVFSYSIRMGMIDDNPCARVRVPKGYKPEKKIYTIDEVRQIIDLLKTAPLKYRAFFILAASSGFRRGELLGLEWKDIDWETRVISVRRTSNYTVARGIYTDTTKTEKSKRSQQFSASVISLLKEFKAEQDKEREKYGSKWEDHDRLFVKWNGAPMNIRTPEDWFRKFCEKNGIEFRGIHCFRHFYASALINANVDVATVSSVLGHSSIGTTTGIYLHAFQEASARAESVISTVLELDGDNQKESTAAPAVIPVPVEVHKSPVVKGAETSTTRNVVKITRKRPRDNGTRRTPRP